MPSLELPDSEPRLRLLPTLAVIALVLFFWSVWALIAGVQAMSALRGAESEVRSLEQVVDLDAYLDGDLDDRVSRAVESLELAEARLDAFALKPIRLLPFFGRQLESAQSLVSSGLEVARVAEGSGIRLRSVLDDDDGIEIHERLQIASVELASLADALGGVDLGPDRGLVGQLRDGRAELDGEFGELRDVVDGGARLLASFSELLAGPEDTLLLIANNAEMRAGSGMILTTGVLRSADGKIELTDLASSFRKNLEIGEVELTSTYEEHFEFLTPEAEWRNLGVTPRFPETAESALRMWEAATGERLDGVMLVDPFMLEALLQGTGPISVGDTVVDADNVIAYLLHDQYANLDVSFTNSERRGQEREVAAAVLTQLLDRDLDLVKLVPALLDAADRRHMMLWSPDASRQRAWSDAGVDGELVANSLMVSSSNRSPSKLDYFIEIRAGLTTEVVDGVREVELMIALDNTVDPEVEHVYVAGPVDGSSAAPGEYIALVTLSLPGNAMRGRFDGVDDLTVVGGDGPTRIIATPVSVLPGERKFVIARFSLPLSQTSIQIEPSGRADPVRWTVGDTRVTDGRRWVVDLS